MKTTFSVVLSAFLLISVVGCSQSSGPTFGPTLSLEKHSALQIASVVQQVDAARIAADLKTLVAFGTRHTTSETESDTRGIGAARRWLKTRFEEAVATRNPGWEPATVSFDRHIIPADGRRVLQDTEVVNVVCEIPPMSEASDAGNSSRVYIIAHYDSRASGANDATSDAPGANDDGSGTVALLELARVLAVNYRVGEHTIVLMAVAGEEQGLYGARAHAAAIADRDDVEVVAVLSNDIIGDPSGPGGLMAAGEVRVFSEGLPASIFAQGDRALSAARFIRSLAMESDSPSRQLARYVEEAADFMADMDRPLPVRPRLIFRPDRFLRGGDHTAFNEVGVPAVRFTEVHENYDHQHQDVRMEDGVQYGDLIEFVDPEYIAGVAKLNLVTAWRLAKAPAAPQNVRIITAELTNSTMLRWDASPSSRGYVVVWRDTTAHKWQHAKRVGPEETEATIDLSKDNYFFGVRALGQSMEPSLVAFPRAARQ